jgi:hypothetical protein
MTRLMRERGIPIVSNTFHGNKGEDYQFGGRAFDPGFGNSASATK